MGWPLPAELDEPALHELIYGRPIPSPAGLRYRTEPDFEYLQRELKRQRHVTLQLLWEEYRELEPGARQLDRLARAGLRVLPGLPRGVCARQSALGGT